MPPRSENACSEYERHGNGPEFEIEGERIHAFSSIQSEIGRRNLAEVTTSNRKRFNVVARVVGLIVLVLFLAAVGRVGWELWWSPAARYKTDIRRMREVIVASAQYNDLHSLDRESRGRIEVGRALQTALANAQCEYGTVARKKVRAIAEELVRTKGEMMRTREGAYALWLRLEEACPEMRNYAWMVSLREMQTEGIIPKFDEPRVRK